MTTYAVTIAVLTDRHLDDDTARDVAAGWAGALRYDPAMTSTSREAPWLRVSAVAPGRELPDVGEALATLRRLLAEHGAQVGEVESVEVVHEREVGRRSARPAVPPMVNAAQFAELAGLSSVQRIYQLESERKTGKRDDFPAPVLDGYWLRSVAEHYASTRKRRPGPAPGKRT